MLSLVITIIMIYMMYYVWIIINFDKNGNQRRNKKGKLKERKMPSEVVVFVKKYNVDLDKLNYRYFLQLMGLVIAFDLSIVITIIGFVHALWLKLLLSFILVIIIVFISFNILGKYFKKKGLTKYE